MIDRDPAHAFVGGGSVNSNSFTLDPTTFVTAGQMFSSTSFSLFICVAKKKNFG